MALTTQWKPCTYEKRATSQLKRTSTLRRQPRMLSTCYRLRQNQTWVRSTSIDILSHSASLFLSPTRHLLSFRRRRIVQPRNSRSYPAEKSRSHLATKVMTALAASLVRRLERRASWRRARSTRGRQRKRRRSSEGASSGSKQCGGLRAVRLEWRRARELRVMKCRCGPFRSSIYNHQLSIRRMYFKQRENSALYKYYQQEEQVRLQRKLQQIKSRKLKRVPSENILPPITHRLNQPKPCQQAQVQAETQRLGKRILQLKSNRSDYFAKVIGLNLSGEWRKGEKQQGDKTSLNQSTLNPKNELI